MTPGGPTGPCGPIEPGGPGSPYGYNTFLFITVSKSGPLFDLKAFSKSAFGCPA